MRTVVLMCSVVLMCGVVLMLMEVNLLAIDTAAVCTLYIQTCFIPDFSSLRFPLHTSTGALDLFRTFPLLE